MLSFNKIKILFEFFKETFLISLGFTLGLFVLLDIGTSFFWGSVFGLLISFFLKETSSNKEYLFYFNRSLSKLQLYGFSLFLNLIITLILIFVFR